MATSIEAVIEFELPLFQLEQNTKQWAGFSPVTKSTLLENGGYNKGCETFQVECLEIGLE